jgi:hypothetical protein
MISYDNNLLIRVLYVTTQRREMGDGRERECVWTIKVMVIMMRKDDYDGEYDNDD